MVANKVRVFIFGSCVSRDIFDQASPEVFDIVGYVARSSLACAMKVGLPPVQGVEVENIASAFQRRMVTIDLNHELPKILEDTQYDLLLYDAIDERFNTYWPPQGGCCTVSNELLSSNFDPKQREGKYIRFGSDEHFSLWSQGFNTLLDYLKRQGRLNRLIINKVYWAEICEDGSDFLPHYSKERIKEANAALHRLYEYMHQKLSDDHFLRYERTAFVGASKHRWGKSPFHYSNEIYESALQQLREIVSRHGAFLCNKAIDVGVDINAIEDLWIDRKLEFCNVFGRKVLVQWPVTCQKFETDLFDANGELAVHPERVVANFSGLEGSYILRMKTRAKELANGLTVRFRLNGWKNIKYLAVGYTYEGSFRHTKILNALKEEWVEYSVGHNDLAFKLQNQWEKPGDCLISDVKLYVKGTPGEKATLEVDLIAYWKEADAESSLPWIREWDGSKKPSEELLNIVYEYQGNCFRAAYSQAEAFLTHGECPLFGETLLPWKVTDAMPEVLETVGTYRFSWQSLHHAVILLIYARDKQLDAPIFAARHFVESWLDRSYFSVDDDQKFAWYDHGTAERLIALCLMWAIGLDHGFDYRFMGRLRIAIFRHSQLLSSEQFYASHQPTRYHNHAWFQDVALMVAAIFIPDFPCSRKWLQVALLRLTDQLAKLILRENEFAVFVENSIGYHNGIKRLVEFASKLIRFAGIDSDIRFIPKELNFFSDLLKYPDKRSPAQGDTFRIPNPRQPHTVARAPYKETAAVVLPKAGYAVIKGNHRDSSWMLCFFATSLSKTHKHEDNLSFTLFFDGIEWLIDPSFYSHEYSAPIPAYLRSAAAHNGVFVPNLPYSIEPGLARLEGRQEDGYVHLSGNHDAYEGLRVMRRLTCATDRLEITCQDELSSSIATAQLRFHCGEHVSAQVKGGEVTLTHPGSNFRLILDVGEAIVERVRGNTVTGHRMGGIVGHGFMQYESIDTLIVLFNQQTEITWRLWVQEREQ